MASVTLYPSGTVSGSNSTWSDESNAYDAYDSSSSAKLTFSKLATTTMYGFLKIDTSDIPTGANIASVQAVTKMSVASDYGKGSNGSWTQCGAVLCSGTTEKGTIQELSAKSTDTTLTMNDASWTADELNDLRIKYTYTTNSYGSQDSAAVLTVYGATITITFEGGTQYTISVKAGDGITVDRDAENTVYGGIDFEIKITPDSGVSITSLTDNGTDVLSKLEKRHEGGEEGTVTGNPTSYTTSGSISGTRYKNCVGKGSSTTATGNDYCRTRGSTATITYSFDLSAIPEEAIINSVTVLVGGHRENTSTSNSNADLQLYTGSTAKGTQTKFTSTSKQVITMDAGEWTRAELLDAKLGFTIGYYGGLVNGVDFTVVYQLLSSDAYYVYTVSSISEDHVILINVGDSKIGILYTKGTSWGSAKNVQKVYQKVNNAWTEVEDLTALNNYIWTE